MTEADAFEVQITYPDASTAQAAAADLVGEGLAACGQVSEIRSVYAWQGAVADEPEWLLTLKTTGPCLAAIEARVRAGHPYDVPQITALAIARGSADYLAWIHDTARAPE